MTKEKYIAMLERLQAVTPERAELHDATCPAHCAYCQQKTAFQSGIKELEKLIDGGCSL